MRPDNVRSEQQLHVRRVRPAIPAATKTQEMYGAEHLETLIRLEMLEDGGTATTQRCLFAEYPLRLGGHRNPELVLPSINR